MYSKSFICACITETWLTDNIANAEILPTNYNIYRYDRKARGGGVLIAVADHISSRMLPSKSDSEIVTVELDLSPKIIICCVYIPPSCSEYYFNSVLHSTFPCLMTVVLLLLVILMHLMWIGVR